MRVSLCAVLVLSIACAGCNKNSTGADTASVESGVRAFTQVVAHDVTQEGPAAWSKHFADRPEFFMAVNGQMAFPSGGAAMAAMPKVALA